MFNIQFTVEQLNALLNILNVPRNAPTMQLAAFIQLIQDQAEKQAEELEKEKETENEQ